jgi:AP endonuclease-1
MPRRSSRKIDTDAVGTGFTKTTTTRKTQQTSVKVETDEVDAKIEPSPAKSLKKRAKSEVGFNSESLISGKESPSGVEITRVKAEEVIGEAQAPKQRPRKRIPPVEDDEDGDEDKAKKITKKRKTKEDKEAEAMPLAARTAVGTLKHAMHIGAHVSAAGGGFPWPIDVISITNISVIYRCTKLGRQCTSNWWQFVRSLP